MARAKLSNKEYHERVKILRKYFDNFGPDRYDLRKPLRPAQKSVISRMFNALKDVASGIVTPVRITKYSRKIRRKIQKQAHQGMFSSPHLKYAFVPTANFGEKVKVGITTETKEIEISSQGVRRLYVDFNPLEVAADPATAAKTIIDRHPDIDRWFIQAGRHEIWQNPELRNIPPDSDRLAFALEYLTTSYGDMRFDRNDPTSHHYANWLGGVVGYRFGDQVPAEEYLKNKRRHKRERQKKREALRRAKRERERQFKEFLRTLI